MKKLVTLVLTFALILSALSVSSCGKKNDEKTIVIGASSAPHAEILESIKQTLADQGYTLDIKIYDDYVLPNKALADGELDANYFQHAPYLNSYNKENNTNLISAASIHYEPFGIYGNGVTDLKALAAGATIIIPADDSNETRALLLLAQEGLVTLKDGVSAATGITNLDVTDNHGYNIVPLEAQTVPAQLKNADAGTIAVINGNYAISSGLKIKDALAIESAAGDAAQTYANIIAVRPGDENSAKIKALIDALKTQAVKDFMDSKYDGAVLPIF